MGQAKNRGSLEQRKVQAKHKIWQEQLKKEKALHDRYWQERKAYSIMVWWQLDMSEEREKAINKHRLNDVMIMAQLFDIYGSVLR